MAETPLHQSVSLPVLSSPRGRGAASNPPNRFQTLSLSPDPDYIPDPDDPAPHPRTEFLLDSSKSIIATNDSPDVGFEASINPYRGCEHGCIYCYARPTHEYLSFSAGLDFETRIMVKTDAPRLLRDELSRKSYKVQILSLSGVTDCYQPIERRLQLTRQCLAVLHEFKNPATIVTKNHLVTRDIDLLSEMAGENLAAVFVSVTTLDTDLQRIMEPRTSTPARRLDAIAKLSGAGIPVGVMLAPVIPGLTDHEIPSILQAARLAGAVMAAYVPLRLPFAVKDLFENWLSEHFPDRKDKILNRIRSMRNGKLNDSTFHTRMRGHGPWAEQLRTLFSVARRKAGFPDAELNLRKDLFRLPPGPQMMLWS